MKIQTIALFLLVVAASSNAEISGILGNFKGLLGGRGEGFLKAGMKLIKNFIGDFKQEKMDGKPDFCAKYECPSYTVKNKTDSYELRCYSGAFWVSTKALGYPTLMGGQTAKMFSRLRKYISGANALGTKMNMTVPVLVELKKKGELTNQKMSFYIPKEFQKEPPKPNRPDVFLEGKEFCAYVRSFGGFQIFYKQYLDQIMKLKKALAKDGLGDAYVKGPLYYAGYNKPWKIFNRHNEVMLIKA